MSEFLRCLAGMIAVVAPLGALASLLGVPPGARAEASARDRWRLAILSPLAALAVLAVAALLNDPLLDWLNISPKEFQFAAGAAMAPLAARLMLTGDSMPPPRELPGYSWLVPFGVPLLAGPSSIIAVICYAARFGDARAIIASAIAVGLVGILFALSQKLERVPLIAWQTLARLSGGALVLLAVELAVNGVHSV